MNIYASAYEHICIGQRPYGHRPTPLQASADVLAFMKTRDTF